MEGNRGSKLLLQAARKSLEGMVQQQWVCQLQRGSGKWPPETQTTVGNNLPQQQGPQQPVWEKLWWLSP